MWLLIESFDMSQIKKPVVIQAARRKNLKTNSLHCFHVIYDLIYFRWIPETGGANVPALNDLLSMYQVFINIFSFYYTMTVLHIYVICF